MGGSRSTTVGGRAGGHGRLKDFPRGIEVLLKKATVDPGFRELLLRDPFAAADSIELSLQDSERRILVNTPKAVLAAMIRNTFVPRQHAASFLRQKAPALLLLLVASTVALDAEGTKGVDPAPFAYAREDATDKMVLIQKALEQYKTEHGSYPTTRSGCRPRIPLKATSRPPTCTTPGSESSTTRVWRPRRARSTTTAWNVWGRIPTTRTTTSPVRWTRSCTASVTPAEAGRRAHEEQLLRWSEI